MPSHLTSALLPALILGLAAVYPARGESLEQHGENHALTGTLIKLDEIKDSLPLLEGLHCDATERICEINGIPRLNNDASLQSPEVLLVTHASTGYNSNRSIEKALAVRIRESKDNGSPVIFLVHSLWKKDLSHYFFSERPTHLVRAEGGEHRLKLKTDRILIAGGLFDACASETVRDAILHADTDGPIRIAFLSDAIFTRDGRGEGTPLNRTFRDRTDSEIMNYLGNEYFKDEMLGTQNRASIGRYARFSDFTFRVLKNGRYLGSFGTGKRPVDLDFLVN